MNANELIKRFPIAIDASATANVHKTIQYNIASPLYVVIDNGTCTVHDGIADKYDVRMTITDDNLIALFKGELSGMVAFVTGKLKIDGDKAFAQRVATLFDSKVILG